MQAAVGNPSQGGEEDFYREGLEGSGIVLAGKDPTQVDT